MISEITTPKMIMSADPTSTVATCVVAGMLTCLAPFAPLAGITGMQATTAHAGTAVVGGRKMSCSAAKVVNNKKSPYVGFAQQGVIVLNPILMRKYPNVTRRIIFLHECAHQYVGFDETAADCWAIKAATKQGWLNSHGVRQVCRSFQKSRGGSYHLPGAARCKAMMRCFNAAKRRKRRISKK